MKLTDNQLNMIEDARRIDYENGFDNGFIPKNRATEWFEE